MSRLAALAKEPNGTAPDPSGRKSRSPIVVAAASLVVALRACTVSFKGTQAASGPTPGGSPRVKDGECRAEGSAISPSLARRNRSVPADQHVFTDRMNFRLTIGGVCSRVWWQPTHPTLPTDTPGLDGALAMQF